MTDAMQMVRDSLGEDAVIVATREENGGKSVRVTAAIEDTPLSALSRRDRSLAFELPRDDGDDWLQYDREQARDDDLMGELIDTLLRHGVPEDVMDQILSCASLMDIDDPFVAFVGCLETLFAFAPLPVKPYKKVLMFVGPPGSGKTLTVAKHVTRCVMQGLSVGVVTTDVVRAGGIEQLEAFTRLLKIRLHRAKTPAELAEAINAAGKVDQIVIDTPGINPFAMDDMKTVAKLIMAGDIEPVLTLPAAMDANESGEVARIFSAIGVRRFLPTRTDVARRLGGVLAAAQQGGIAFSDISNTPKVTDGLGPLSPRTLALCFFPRNTAGEKGTDPSPSFSLRKDDCPSSPSRKKKPGS